MRKINRDYVWSLIDRANRMKAVQHYGSPPLAQAAGKMNTSGQLGNALSLIDEEVRKRYDRNDPVEVELAREITEAYDRWSERGQ